MNHPHYIDLHSDTITKLHYPLETLRNNKRMVSIDSMQTGNVFLQCFSAFIPTGHFPKLFKDQFIWNRFLYIAKKKDSLLKHHTDVLLPILNIKDIETCDKSEKIGVIFTLEDAGVIGHDLTKIKTAYNHGIRISTLSWNHENTLAFPNSNDRNIMQKGLKDFGIAAVEEMHRLGIIIDVSHLSDGGFWDVERICKGPFIASHSNCRALTNHPRNLSDDMIRAIANHGGIIGLNFSPNFLTDTNPKKESRIEDMVLHIQHIYNIGGLNVLSIGSDFDGIKGHLEINTPSKMPLLFDALENAGFSSNSIDAICHKNAIRVMKECWK